MAHPKTPKKTQPSTPTNTPTTRSQKSSSTNAKLPIRQLLAANNMPMEDNAALRRHPEILQWAQEVQEGQRNSAMKPASEQKLADRRRAYEESNEDTFIRHFMSALLRDKRERKVGELWEEICWDQDCFMEAWNQSFQRDCIPRIEVPDALTTKVLEANPRIKDPKPDITYGISSDPFSADQMNVNRLYYSQAGICPSDLWHPFCIVEAKMKGTIQEAEHQCVRGGAALVNAARQLKYLSGIDNLADGPDMDTAIFSLAVITTSVVLHVHWAEVVDGKTLFHMHHVYTYALANKGVGSQLRHDLNNILDWGTLTRKIQIIEMLDNIAIRVKSHTIRILPTSSTSIEDASTAGPDNNNEEDNVQDEEQDNEQDEEQDAEQDEEQDAEQDEEQDAEQDEEQDAEPHVNQEDDNEEDDTNPNQQLITNLTQVLDDTGSPAHKRRRIA